MANVSGAIAPQAKAGSVKEVTTASFRADVLTASTRQPVLVDFWAPWCGPCKQLAPALEKAVADSGGKVALVKMNIDDHPQIPGQLGIQSIPAVIAFDKGQPVDGFVGALPESQIRGFIERLVGPLQNESAALLAQADEAAAKGDAAGAAAIYSEILTDDPGEAKAIGGFSRTSTSPPTARRRESLAEVAPRRPRPARSRTRRSSPLGRRCSSPSKPRTSASSRPSRGPSPPIEGLSSPLRPCGHLVGEGRSSRRGRRAPRNHPPQPQMERRGGAQTIVAAVRGLGFDGPRIGRGAA